MIWVETGLLVTYLPPTRNRRVLFEAGSGSQGEECHPEKSLFRNWKMSVSCEDQQR